jgi:hypothetical protein
MSLQNKHPLYGQFLEDWQMMRDTYRGEKVIKDKGRTYLPPTSGMIQDGMEPNAPGWNAYQAYKQRAVFHDFVSDAVEAMIGMMHHKSPVIELPKALEPMRDKATVNGESLEHCLRRINEQQLVTGRLGLLLDFPNTPTTAEPTPYIAMYNAESIINWDDGARDQLVLPRLNLVVLNESEYERQANFEWVFVEKYRVLMLGDPNDNESVGENAVYQAGVFREANSTFQPTDLITPQIRGNALNDVPFVFINTKDLVSSPDDPPLLGLARLALAIYRGEADYRQNLFMQGQDTLVVIGAQDEDFRVGAGATITLQQGGDAKYIGVGSDGLSEQREALDSDKKQAANKAGQLIDTDSKAKESGEALSIRVAAQTATLNQIARSSAAGLERILRHAATWVGANPDEVSVQPNLDFVDESMTGKDLVDLMTAKTMGAPLSLKTVHGLAKNRGLTEMEFEDEQSEIEGEAPLPSEGTEEGGDPEDDGDDELLDQQS